MSDHTDEVQPDVPSGEGTDDVVDLDAMTEAELRERHAQLTAQIDELAQQDPTVERAEQINELRRERNATVEAVRTLMAATADVDDVEMPETADTTTETETSDEGDEANTTETEGAAPEQGVADEGTTTTNQEAPVSDNQPTTPGDDGGTSADGQAALDAAAQIVDGAAPELAVTAGAGRPVAPSTPAFQPIRQAFVAGADQHAFSQGAPLENAGALARAWDSSKNVRATPGGGPVRAVVASLPAFADHPDLSIEVLDVNKSATDNDRLIAQSVEAWRAKRTGEALPPGVTAAICEPLDIIREIPECGEVDTPFTDLFPQRPIGRLGFQFTPATATAVSVDGAINVWTEEDQEAVDEEDPSTWKPCIAIECATPVSVTAEEIVTCVQVDTATEMSSPERVREVMHKIRVQRARRREQYQLAAFDATAFGRTWVNHNGYGAVPTFFEAVETLMPQIVYAERLDPFDYDVVIEPGFLNKLTIDRHNVCNPVELPEAQAETLAYVRRVLGLRVMALRDFKGVNPFQANSAAGVSAALTPLPDTDRIRFVPAGAYIYGSTGEEATGWQTDPQLQRQNKKQAFSAEWTLLAKHGCHPAVVLDVTSVPDGGRGGCSTSFGFSEGS